MHTFAIYNSFMHYKGSLINKIIICFLLVVNFNYAQSTWTANPQQAPLRSGGLMLLMSDGAVLCKSSEGNGDGFGNLWFKLKPDNGGSYVNGTWSIAAPMKDSRLYCSSQVLKNGKMYVAGGEYGSGIGSAELYDSQSNSWTDLPAGNGHLFADANSAILDNGSILQADLATTGKRTYLYNPNTNSYNAGPNCLAGHDEATWIKLPDNSIFFVNYSGTGSERYIPALNQWTADASSPVALYDNYVGETGPSMVLPNGKVICFGATGNTAYFNPSGNTSAGNWQTGPPLPAGKGCPDTQAAMQVDGKILLTASNAVTAAATAYDPPTYFYEFDYLANSFTPMQAPGGGLSINDSAFNFNMLNLPDGSIMLSQVNNKNFYFHKAIGAPLAAGVPSISGISQTGCKNAFKATGLLFNGISEGASYGDDWQMNTNFPIIRLQSGTYVYYARTYNWNHTGVQHYNEIDTTEFTLPANLPYATYSLFVVVNGIPSAPYNFTYSSFPTLTSSLNLATICSGNTINYQASANPANTTVQWTRASVSGISNAAITSPQNLNPQETFTNSSLMPKSVVYDYTLTNGSCQSFYSVTCLVSNGPAMSIIGNTLICNGDQNTLAVSGADTFTWSTGIINNTIVASPSVNTVYQATANDVFGCSATTQKTVALKPPTNFTITGNNSICTGDSTSIGVIGLATQFNWSTGAIVPRISVSPLVTTVYTVTCNGPNTCSKSDTIRVTVNVCTGLSEKTNSGDYHVMPNPFSETIFINLAKAKSKNCTVQVLDLFGRIVYSNELKYTLENQKQAIAIPYLASGIYALIISDANTKMSMKIIKE